MDFESWIIEREAKAVVQATDGEGLRRQREGCSQLKGELGRREKTQISPSFAGFLDQIHPCTFTQRTMNSNRSRLGLNKTMS